MLGDSAVAGKMADVWLLAVKKIFWKFPIALQSQQGRIRGDLWFILDGFV
jgi:hypothetical protein